MSNEFSDYFCACEYRAWRRAQVYVRDSNPATKKRYSRVSKDTEERSKVVMALTTGHQGACDANAAVSFIAGVP